MSWVAEVSVVDGHDTVSHGAIATMRGVTIEAVWETPRAEMLTLDPVVRSMSEAFWNDEGPTSAFWALSEPAFVGSFLLITQFRINPDWNDKIVPIIVLRMLDMFMSVGVSVASFGPDSEVGGFTFGRSGWSESRQEGEMWATAGFRPLYESPGLVAEFSRTTLRSDLERLAANDPVLLRAAET